MRDRTKKTLTITMENLTEAQVIALNDLFATWQQLGGVGSSRWTAFFADGDGDFRPKITINGEKPKFTDLIPRDQFWSPDQTVALNFVMDNSAYRIDFDWIGWKLTEKDEAENGSRNTQG